MSLHRTIPEPDFKQRKRKERFPLPPYIQENNMKRNIIYSLYRYADICLDLPVSDDWPNNEGERMPEARSQCECHRRVSSLLGRLWM